jgi:hypothetical protein
MNAGEKGMRSIWFFVGLLLSAIGLIELAAGVYDLFSPTKLDVTLANLHANIWWGMLITIAGVTYLLKNRSKYIDV